MTLIPGMRLGPYEIVAPLGAGGMGEVYRAKDTRLGREVAIKVLPQHLSANPEVRTRFEREAKTVSSLNHSNICTLFDVGREGDTDYLVMELIEGETLAQRLMKGALPVSEVLRLGSQIADALDRAHRAGVIHRDLKPGNVMLTKGGAKLMDFGLARATGLVGPVSGSGATMAALTQSPTVAQALTAEGTIVGTFQYMSPEQLEGSEADPRADLWALGCVLYEMVTGVRAFEGKSQASLISSIMKEEPRSLLEIAPVSPPALDRLVRACLAKEADDRLQTAHDVKLQLQWIAEAGSSSGVAAPVVARRHSRERVAWVAALSVVVLAGIAAVLLLPRSGGSRAAIYAALLPPAGGAFSSGFDTPQPIAVSPDGKEVVFCARRGEGAEFLWVRSLDSPEARPLPGTEGASGPFFSPDGRSVGFFANGKLKRVEIAGGPVITVTEVADHRGGSWGSAGVILLSAGSDGPILRVSAEGGPTTPVTVLDTTLGESTHRYPVFLPDGKHFLYLARRSGAGTGREPAIYAASLGSPKRKRVASVASNVVYASGRLIYVSGGVLLAQPFDVGRLSTTGPAIPVAEDVRWEERFSRGVFAASQNGVLVFMTGSALARTQLMWLDRTGRALGRVGEPSDYTYGGTPEISPDGSSAAMAILNSERGTSDVFQIDLETGRRTRVTVEESDHPACVWSHDGTRVLVLDTAGSLGHIVFRTLGGTRADTVLTRPGYPWPRSASPDGRYILYSIRGGLNVAQDLLAAPTSGTEPPIPVAVSPGDEEQGKFSPDGRWVAYMSNESGRPEVYVVTFPAREGKWQVSQGGGSEPRWSRDGRELFYIDAENRFQSVEVIHSPSGFTAGAVRPLFQYHGVGGTWRYDVSPDGSRFLVTTAPENEPLSSITIITNWTARIPMR